VSYGGNDGSDLPLKQVKHALNSSPPEMKVNKKEAFCEHNMRMGQRTCKKMKTMAKK
jgi:hypothetical protein